MKVTTTMVRRGAMVNLGLGLLLAAGAASAQMYKWTDANGKVHFTDQPPPASGKPAEIRNTTGAPRPVELPYALAIAARNHPVTLYTTTPCPGCDLGRTHLKNRGIPFAEKTVSSMADQDKLKDAGGDGTLPLLTVGGTKITGFQPDGWDKALNTAQYPATKILPANYRYPAPQTAAPAPPKAEPAAKPVAPPPADEPKAVPPPRNAPPGFRF